MASIRTGIELADNFTAPIMGIINSVNMAVASMEDMSHAMNADISTASIEAARDYLNQATIAADQFNQSMQDIGTSGISESINRQDELNQRVDSLQTKVERARKGFSGWQKAIIVANNAVGLVKNTLGRLGVTDMGGAFDRIDTMNRFSKTVAIMTGDANMANAALAKLKDTTVGTAYGLDVASKATQGFMTRGMSIGAATEQVRIWADAVSFYGKGTNEQLENVVDAVGKIYTKGTVEQMQLDRIFDAGIGAAEIYAKAVGRSIGEVKDDLTNREISSAEFIDTVSKALDQGVSAGAAKEAGGTWATTFANVQAAITRGWTSTIQNLDSALESHGLPSTIEMVTMFGQKAEKMLNSLGSSMYWLVGMAVNVGEVFRNVGNVAGNAGSFISNNWGVIAPAVWAVVAAFGVYYAIMGIIKTIELISAGTKIALTVATFACATAMRTQASSTAYATAAQYGLNTAILSCPLTWLIVLIMALVAVLVIVANRIAKTGAIATTTFGAICGGANVVIQFFKNLGLEAANIFLGIGSAAMALRTNIITAFYNAACEAKSSLYDLLFGAMKVVEGICKALNKLPFVSFDYSGISAAANKYADICAANSAIAEGNKKDYVSIRDAYNLGSSQYDPFQKDWAYNAYTSGADWGDKVSNKIKNMLKIKMPKTPDTPETMDYSNALGDTALNTSKTADNTEKTAKALDITSEDLKYLRDIAERGVVNRYTTAAINVNMTNHNNINNDMDLDGITNHLRSTIEEQMNAAAEGVH